MDIRLRSWLAHTFQEQLLLGNSWLQDKNSSKASGVKTEFNRAWADLYHDSGSCLDITNDIHPEHASTLQVVQTNPLTLTDGRCQVVPHLTAHCLRDLSRPLTLRAVVAVRKYTIRFTSYGPPRTKLCFLLQRVDWLGVNTKTFHGADGGPLKPIHSTEGISALLEQLQRTRALEDIRRLRSDTHSEVDEAAMAGTRNHADGAPIGESTPQTQMPHTQSFGTQLAYPVRARASKEEPQFPASKGLEPVLAGNTKCEEIRPNAANTEYEKRMHLMSLLHKVNGKQSPGKPGPAPVKGFIRTAFDNKQGALDSPTVQSTYSPSVTAGQRSTRERYEEEKAKRASPAPNRKRKRATETDPISPRSIQAVEELSNARQQSEQGSLDTNITAESACPWMQGFIFNREAFRVPAPQQMLLQKGSSWHKPQPGCTGIPSGNIPILILETLSKIADERAAVEEVSETDSAEDFDPSPDSVVDNIDPSPGNVTALVQDVEPATSQISWSPSPSPEPPQKPIRTHQGLPPDSSFEHEHRISNTAVDGQRTITREHSQRPVTVHSSNEKEPSPPPSSPPRLANDSDEEMEMEAVVPVGLGEDAQQVTSPRNFGKQQQHGGSPNMKPVVQVKETPYAKVKSSEGKSIEALRFANSPPEKSQKSSSSSKHTSSTSTSIVYGTHNEPDSFASVEGKICRVAMGGDVDSRSQKTGPTAAHQKEPTRQGTPRQTDSGISHDTSMPDAPLEMEILSRQIDQEDQAPATPAKVMVKEPFRLQPDLTPVSAQITTTSRRPSGDHLPRAEATSPNQVEYPSGLMKRKLGDSPSKNSKRQSKRREIKIVGFGDNAPSTIDPATVLRQERAESLRKFREERKFSTSFESRPRPDSMQQDPDAMEVDSPGGHISNTSVRSMSPRHRSLYDDPGPSKLLPKTGSAPQHPPSTFRTNVQEGTVQPLDGINKEDSQTVFQAFKVAYPEYTGDTKHFERLCMQMYGLDLEDRMVPKWQWDDFIIRNRTDYKEYLVTCADQGDDPEPYIRFYKDSIRDTLFKSNVIENKNTLLRAFEELDVKIPTPKSSRPPTRTSNPSRTSLPGAFNVQKQSSHDRSNGRTRDRPRHSLPTSSHTTLRDPNPPPTIQNSRSPYLSTSHRSTPSDRTKSNFSHLERLTSNPRQSSSDADAIESTGDPFRDYYFAVQRSTSWTGSTTVDKNLPWPRNLAVRPSVEDAPKGKVDVLRWKDDV